MNAVVDPDGPSLCDLPSNPVPSGARAGYMRTRDNIRLRYALWRPRHSIDKGTICLVQGRCEFIEKYFETIEDFLARGFGVATFDWRGQGGSDRLIGNSKLGYVDQFSDYWTDLSSFHADILLPDCPPPYYLVGHSMGGQAALMAGARDRLMFDRMFLSAPMVEIYGLPMSSAALATVAEAICYMGLGRLPVSRGSKYKAHEDAFPGNNLTSDFRRYMRTVDVLNNRPDLEITAPTFRWVASALRSNARAAGDDFPGRVNVPVLMLAAARDEVVSTSAIEHLGLRMRTGRHAVIAASRHELFMENDDVRGQVFAAFDSFITEQSS
jgi:lysophospholipase